MGDASLQEHTEKPVSAWGVKVRSAARSQAGRPRQLLRVVLCSRPPVRAACFCCADHVPPTLHSAARARALSCTCKVQVPDFGQMVATKMAPADKAS